MNTEAYDCFHVTNLPVLPDTWVANSNFDSLCNFLEEYTGKMILLDRQGSTEEVKYIQPQSFLLLEKMCSLLQTSFPEECQVVNKNIDNSGIEYVTTLMTDSGKVIYVNGETDATVLYRGIGVFTWEDKNLKLLLTQVSEKGQPLAEVRGTAESFKASVSKEAPMFYGEITSGFWWSVCIQKISNGNFQYYIISIITL